MCSTRYLLCCRNNECILVYFLIRALGRCQTYTLVSLENERLYVYSLYDEPVCFLYQKIGFQFDKDSRRFAFGYVYILSGFLLFPQQQRKPFGLWVVSLAISSKILLCDNSGTMTWSKELKYHYKRKNIKRMCYLIVKQYMEVI